MADHDVKVIQAGMTLLAGNIHLDFSAPFQPDMGRHSHFPGQGWNKKCSKIWRQVMQPALTMLWGGRWDSVLAVSLSSFPPGLAALSELSLVRALPTVSCSVPQCQQTLLHLIKSQTLQTAAQQSPAVLQRSTCVREKRAFPMQTRVCMLCQVNYKLFQPQRKQLFLPFIKMAAPSHCGLKELLGCPCIPADLQPQAQVFTRKEGEPSLAK